MWPHVYVAKCIFPNLDRVCFVLRNAATASSYALGIFVNNWAAGYLTSAVVQIIIQDMRWHAGMRLVKKFDDGYCSQLGGLDGLVRALFEEKFSVGVIITSS